MKLLQKNLKNRFNQTRFVNANIPMRIQCLFINFHHIIFKRSYTHNLHIWGETPRRYLAKKLHSELKEMRTPSFMWIEANLLLNMTAERVSSSKSDFEKVKDQNFVVCTQLTVISNHTNILGLKKKIPQQLPTSRLKFW